MTGQVIDIPRVEIQQAQPRYGTFRPASAADAAKLSVKDTPAGHRGFLNVPAIAQFMASGRQGINDPEVRASMAEALAEVRNKGFIPGEKVRHTKTGEILTIDVGELGYDTVHFIEQGKVPLIKENGDKVQINIRDLVKLGDEPIRTTPAIETTVTPPAPTVDTTGQVAPVMQTPQSLEEIKESMQEFQRKRRAERQRQEAERRETERQQQELEAARMAEISRGMEQRVARLLEREGSLWGTPETTSTPVTPPTPTVTPTGQVTPAVEASGVAGGEVKAAEPTERRQDFALRTEIDKLSPAEKDEVIPFTGEITEENIEAIDADLSRMGVNIDRWRRSVNVKTDFDAIAEKYPNIFVRFKDVNGQRHSFPIKEAAELVKIPEFTDRIREAWIHFDKPHTNHKEFIEGMREQKTAIPKRQHLLV